MRQTRGLLIRIFASLLRLYPPGFREEFSEEMQVVFEEGVDESCMRGCLEIGYFFLRELVSLPGNLLREHWFELLQRKTVMFAKLKTEGNLSGEASLRTGDYQSSSWLQASLAGLPHLLMALILLPGVLIAYGFLPGFQSTWNHLGIVWAVCLGLFTFVVLFYLWRRNWPRWGASWYVYGIMLAGAGLVAVVQYGDSKLGDAILGILLFTIFPIGMALFFYLVARKDHIKGLLMAIPFMAIFWFVFLEFISNEVESLFTLLAFLFSGIIALVIVRLGDWKLGIWLAIGLTLISGLGASYAHFYHTVYPPEAPYSAPMVNLSSFADFFLPQLLGSTTLILGPLLLWSLWHLGKRSGHMGVLAYNLVFCGMLLILVAIIGYFWLVTQSQLWIYSRYASTGFTYIGLLGILLVITGSVLLIMAAWYNQIIQSRFTLAGLGLISFCMPWVFVLIYTSLGIPNPWVLIIESYKFLIYSVGSIWVVSTSWMVTHLDLKLSPAVR